MAPADGGELAPAEREMTIRHLLTHTSGARDPRGRAETYAFPTMAAYMQNFAKLPLQAQPGAKWLYGDSLDVLGYLVERISGQSLDRFLQQHVLDPLGMRDTHYWPPAAKQRRRAVLVCSADRRLIAEGRVEETVQSAAATAVLASVRLPLLSRTRTAAMLCSASAGPASKSKSSSDAS